MKYGRWNGSGGLYGTRAQVKEARRLVRRALRGNVTRLQFLDDRLLRIAARFTTPYRWLTGLDLKRTLEIVKPVYGLIKGIPTEKPMASCYWRKRTPVPAEADPDRDGCGLLWCAPVAPAEGDSVLSMTALAEDILLAHGFEPMISLTLTTDRAVTCVVSISYDREVAGEDERAMQCYRELLERMTAPVSTPTAWAFRPSNSSTRRPPTASSCRHSRMRSTRTTSWRRAGIWRPRRRRVPRKTFRRR